MVLGLDEALGEKISDLECFLDSELIVKQINGEYRVKDEKLIKLFSEVKTRISKFEKVTFSHIRREKNKEADSLVNVELDKRAGS